LLGVAQPREQAFERGEHCSRDTAKLAARGGDHTPLEACGAGGAAERVLADENFCAVVREVVNRSRENRDPIAFHYQRTGRIDEAAMVVGKKRGDHAEA
jgi:hypothetical protein